MCSNLKITDNIINSMNCPNIHSIFNEIFQRKLLQNNGQLVQYVIPVEQGKSVSKVVQHHVDH